MTMVELKLSKFMKMMMKLLLMKTNFEALPPLVPTYLRAVVGPIVNARCNFNMVCGLAAKYTCVRVACAFAISGARTFIMIPLFEVCCLFEQAVQKFVSYMFKVCYCSQH